MDTAQPLAGDAEQERSEVVLSEPTFVGYYERWRAGVYGYIRARSATNEEAADLTASAFERAWRSRHTFSGDDDAFAAWVFRIARHLAIDAARRRERARRGLVLWPMPEPAPDPANLVLRDEADRLLVRRMSALSPPQRDALLLRYAGGLTARQIGGVLGKGEAATQKLITRALKRLKEAYRDDH